MLSNFCLFSYSTFPLYIQSLLSKGLVSYIYLLIQSYPELIFGLQAGDSLDNNNKRERYIVCACSFIFSPRCSCGISESEMEI